MLSAPFLTPAETKILVILSASVKRFSVSRMRDFYKVIPKMNRFSSLVTKPLKTSFLEDMFLELIHLLNRVWHTNISRNATEMLQFEDLAV